MGEKETDAAVARERGSGMASGRTGPRDAATGQSSGRTGALTPSATPGGSPTAGNITHEDDWEAPLSRTGGDGDPTDDNTDGDDAPESAINNSHSNIKNLRSTGGGGGNEDWTDDNTDADGRHQALVNNETLDEKDLRLNGLPPGTPIDPSGIAVGEEGVPDNFAPASNERSGPIRIDSTPARVSVQGIDDTDLANELAIGDQGAVEEHPKKPVG